MFVLDPGQQRWVVARRRLAWRPRLPRWFGTWWSVAEGLANPITGIVSLVIVAGLAPILLWAGLNWLASLIATPFAAFARARLGRPTVVFARADHSPDEWSARVDGRRAGEALVRQVGEEIRRHGTPVSLNAPPQVEVSLTAERPVPWFRPLVARFKRD